MKLEDIKRRITLFCKTEYFPMCKMRIGSGAALVMHGIRQECNDIDVEMPVIFFDIFKQDGLKCVEFQCGYTGTTRELLRIGNIDIHKEGEFFTDEPEIDVIDGFYVHSVKTVYEMKKRLNREKDQEDLRLIEQYMDERSIQYEPRLKKLSDGLKIQCVNENPNKFA